MVTIGTLQRKYHSLLADHRFSEILAGSSLSLVAKVAATGLATVSSIIVARMYGPEVLGTLAVVNSFLALATIIATLGVNSSVLRFIPEQIVRYSATSAFAVYRKSVLLVVSGSLLLGVALFCSSGAIAAELFHKPHLSVYLALASLVIVARSLNDLNTQSVRGLKMLKAFALMQVLPATAMLVGLTVLTPFFERKDIPIYTQFAAWAIAAAAGSWILDRAFKTRVNSGEATHALPLKNILSVSLPMLMTSVFGYLSCEAGTIILGVYRTESEVGYYAVAVRIATLTSFLLAAINTIAAPRYSELYQENKIDDLFHVAKMTSKLLFWTTTPLLICLALLGYPLLTILFGSAFAVAYVPLVILVLGQFVNSVSGSTALFMNMTDNHNVLVRIMAVAATVNIVLNILLIPAFGSVGAAIAATTSISLWNISVLLYIHSKYGRSIGYLPFGKAGVLRRKGESPC